MLSVEEAHKLFPLMDPKHFAGAIYDPIEGHVDPWGVTHAYAKSAQIGGAEIVKHTRVDGPRPARRTARWDVITEQGQRPRRACRQRGRPVGSRSRADGGARASRSSPWSTSTSSPRTCPNSSGKKEMLHVVDFEGEIYMRQERGGMLLGTYERAGVPWSEKETPWNFGHELLQNDLDRIAPSLEVGFAHFPALERAGIKKVINGPFTFAPDGNPLIGPIRGLRNYWVACGVMAGFSQGGGVGLALVQLDGRRRSGLRRLGDGRRALWRLGDAGLHQRQGARELFPALPHPLPQRGTRRGASAAHDADLRPAAGGERRVWRVLRARAPALVRA